MKAAIVLRVFAGLFGAAGVAGAAYAAHGGDAINLSAAAAAILLAHGPALLALSTTAERQPRVALVPGILLIAGTALFSGDLYARLLFDGRLFANAAPSGGVMLIAGWLAVAVGAAFVERR